MAVVEHVLPSKSSSQFSPDLVGGIAAPLRRYFVCDTNAEIPPVFSSPSGIPLQEGDIVFSKDTHATYVYQVWAAGAIWKRLDTDLMAYAAYGGTVTTGGVICSAGAWTDGVLGVQVDCYCFALLVTSSQGSVALAVTDSWGNYGFSFGYGFTGNPVTHIRVPWTYTPPSGFTTWYFHFGVSVAGYAQGGSGGPPDYIPPISMTIRRT